MHELICLIEEKLASSLILQIVVDFHGIIQKALPCCKKYYLTGKGDENVMKIVFLRFILWWMKQSNLKDINVLPNKLS